MKGFFHHQDIYVNININRYLNKYIWIIKSKAQNSETCPQGPCSHTILALQRFRFQKAALAKCIEMLELVISWRSMKVLMHKSWRRCLLRTFETTPGPHKKMKVCSWGHSHHTQTLRLAFLHHEYVLRHRSCQWRLVPSANTFVPCPGCTNRSSRMRSYTRIIWKFQKVQSDNDTQRMHLLNPFFLPAPLNDGFIGSEVGTL